ncbi:MAG: major facilitator superfamily transporter [Candidatus Nomurabacteria bacterium]|nr:major facilitator superfamily transporter [Candidatus Nomurabacteria bacterium]
MLASIVALIAAIYFSKYIKRFHTYTFTFGLVILEMLAMLAMATTNSAIFIGIFFVVHFLLQSLLYVCLNIFVESFSHHAETGSIRGLFLVILNMGILVSPVIGGALLKIGSFEILYIVTSLTLIPFLYFLHKYLSHIKEPAYHSVDLFWAIRQVSRNTNLKGALIAMFIVQSFYAVMIIYSPIYLVTLGIPLTTYLSFILPLALVPLVLLPYEVGVLADTKYGEKEIMITGLCILAITAFMCVIITSNDPRVWIGILVVSRIGAALVETMAYTYFFKKIKSTDSSLNALFNNAGIFATIFIGAVGILISPFLIDRPQLMFLVLGGVILWGISYVLPIKDTR